MVKQSSLFIVNLFLPPLENKRVKLCYILHACELRAIAPLYGTVSVQPVPAYNSLTPGLTLLPFCFILVVYVCVCLCFCFESRVTAYIYIFIFIYLYRKCIARDPSCTVCVCVLWSPIPCTSVRHARRIIVTRRDFIHRVFPAAPGGCVRTLFLRD